MLIASKQSFLNNSGDISGGKRLLYIENSTAREYIKTGIYPTDKSRFELEYISENGYTSAWSVFFGCTKSDDSPNSVLWRYYSSSSTTLNAWFGQPNYTSPTVPVGDKNVKHIVSIEYGKCTYDGVEYPISSNSLSNPYEVFLFGGNHNGFWRPQKFKCFRFSVYENHKLIQDLCPAIKNDGTVCMYDFVTKTFLLNSGSGTFTYMENNTV